MRSQNSGSRKANSAWWTISLAALTLALFPAHSQRVQGRCASVNATNARAVIDCQGTACSQVSLTWDEDKQQYKAQNSSDRWVRVSAANMAADVSICIGPGKDAYIALKSIVAPYRANYGEACDQAAPGE